MRHLPRHRPLTCEAKAALRDRATTGRSTPSRPEEAGSACSGAANLPCSRRPTTRAAMKGFFAGGSACGLAAILPCAPRSAARPAKLSHLAAVPYTGTQSSGPLWPTGSAWGATGAALELAFGEASGLWRLDCADPPGGSARCGSAVGFGSTRRSRSAWGVERASARGPSAQRTALAGRRGQRPRSRGNAAARPGCRWGVTISGDGIDCKAGLDHTVERHPPAGPRRPSIRPQGRAVRPYLLSAKRGTEPPAGMAGTVGIIPKVKE